MKILTILDKINLLAHLETLAGRLYFGDWRKARRRGLAGVLAELLGAVVGANAWEIRVSRNGNLSGADCARLLRHYGVRTWGHRTTSDHFILHVERRQARWAEYLLRRAGAPLDSATFDAANVRWASGHQPGTLPPAWADRGRFSANPTADASPPSRRR